MTYTEDGTNSECVSSTDGHASGFEELAMKPFAYRWRLLKSSVTKKRVAGP
jgi:hypothetical protein